MHQVCCDSTEEGGMVQDKSPLRTLKGVFNINNNECPLNASHCSELFKTFHLHYLIDSIQ